MRPSRVSEEEVLTKLAEAFRRHGYDGASVRLFQRRASLLTARSARARKSSYLRSYFFATTATFSEAGNGCTVGGLKPACASMSEYSANV